MSEFLTVRLSSEQNSPIHWLVWSTSNQEVIASGELDSWLQLDELQPYAEQRTTIALLASQDVMLSDVEIPAGASRQFDTMLPFLVEEEMAQEVDDLHFTVLSKDKETAHISAVEYSWIERILKTFRDQGIEIKKILPDTLALPLEENGSSAVLLGEQWLMRDSEFAGVAVDASWLPLFMQERQGQDEFQVACYSSLPEGVSEEVWQAKPAELPMALLAPNAIASKVNLLTGDFKPKSSWGKNWKVWQKVAIAASLFVAATVGQQILTINQYEAQADAYRAESERIFRSVFPNKRKIPTISYLKRQMNDEAKRLSGGGSEDGMLLWMTQLPATIGGVKDMEILSVKYDGNRDELRIQAKSTDFQNFEQARAKMAQSFAVEQGQLNRSGTAVIGSFTLKRK